MNKVLEILFGKTECQLMSLEEIEALADDDMEISEITLWVD